MNDLSLAIAVTGLVILGPVAGATSLGPSPDGQAQATIDGPALQAAHSNATATDASGANTSTPASPRENASTPVAESSGDDTAAAEPGPPANLSPGSALAGAVSAQGAEVESEVDERAFEGRLNASAHNRSKAAAIATRQAVLEERLATLRNRTQSLERAHENGSISESRYRATVTGLTAKAMALERQSNRTARVARGLPRSQLEAAGVNTTSLGRLQNAASELSGPETRRIAHSIAGRDVGQSVADNRRPEHAGPPENPGGEGRSGRNDRGARGQEDEAAERGQEDESQEDEADERGREGDRGPPDDADRGSQNESDDRSDRDDRGRRESNETDTDDGEGTAGQTGSKDRGGADEDEGSDDAGENNGSKGTGEEDRSGGESEENRSDGASEADRGDGNSESSDGDRDGNAKEGSGSGAQDPEDDSKRGNGEESGDGNRGQGR